jgi:hypothetical protein
MPYTFNQLHEKLKTARDPFIGKPDGSNTRIVLLDGPIDAPTCIAVKHHDTYILKYYPDGAIDVNTCWTSVTTLARFREYAGLYVSNQKLPSFNRRRPVPEKTMCLKGVNFNGINGYLRLHPNGEVDLDTVRPLHVEVITDPPAVARFQRKAKELDQQLLIRVKLGAPCTGAKNRWAGEDWLRQEWAKPLEQIDYALAPPRLDLSGGTFWFARQLGAVEKIQMKEIHN